MFIVSVTECFGLFKRRTDAHLQFVEQGSAESIAEVGIVEVIDITPKAVIAVSAFRDETMDMRIPFKIPAKGVKDHDKTGREVHGFILFKKHTGNNAVYRMKKAVKEGAVIEEKVPELGINGKNTMPVGNIEQFKGHRGGALHGIKVAASRTEAAVAAERDEFQLSTVRTAVHGTAKGGVTTVNHFIYVFNNRSTWM